MKSIRTALVVALATAALVTVAAPASAAPPTLPAQDQLITVTCSATLWASLVSVDSQSGLPTLVGTDANYACGYQGAWDPATSTYFGVDGDGSDSRLVTIDVVTGATVVVGAVVDSVSSAPIFVDALVIGNDGAAYFVGSGELYSIDLTSAVATDLGPLTAVTGDAWGFSVDPTTGDLYLLQENGDLFEIDPDAVTATYRASWTLSTGADYAYGLAIDHAGTAWVVEWQNDSNFYGPVLWSTPLAAFGTVQELSGKIAEAGGFNYENWWVAVVPAPAVPAAVEPALADTGINASQLAGVGLLLGVLGFGLVARTRRRAA